MEQTNCVCCLQPITNPVCTRCYLKEVSEFLRYNDINGTAKEIILNNIKKKINNDSLNQEKCILCKKEILTVCTYCFFYNVSRILREMNFNDHFVEYFMITFLDNSE